MDWHKNKIYVFCKDSKLSPLGIGQRDHEPKKTFGYFSRSTSFKRQSKHNRAELMNL